MVAGKAAKAEIRIIFSGKRNAIYSRGWRGGHWCTRRRACAGTRRTISIVAAEGAESRVISRAFPSHANLSSSGGCRGSWLRGRGRRGSGSGSGRGRRWNRRVRAQGWRRTTRRHFETLGESSQTVGLQWVVESRG